MEVSAMTHLNMVGTNDSHSIAFPFKTPEAAAKPISSVPSPTIANNCTTESSQAISILTKDSSQPESIFPN